MPKLIAGEHKRTADGQDVVELWDGRQMVLKAYANKEGTVVRIVLPELESEHQVQGKIDGPVRYVQFERKTA